MTTLRAFHGKQEIKDFYIARIRAHYEADEIIKDKCWENGKGSAVGCTLHNSNYSDYEKKLGISRDLAYLKDGIFEELPTERAEKFPLQFLQAIAVGADLSTILPKFMHWLLIDSENGAMSYAETTEAKAYVQGVADLYKRKIDGENIHRGDWEVAKIRAYGYGYITLAAASDASVADVASAYAYAADVRQNARLKQADKLLELLSTAGI